MNEQEEGSAARVESICKAEKGIFIRYPDGQYKCRGVPKATIDLALQKQSSS